MQAWAEFEAARADMARVLQDALERVPIAFIATVRRDGAPRVHPFCPIFAEGRLLIAINPTSPKRWDLRNDGRYAMHALPGERDEEFYATGRAAQVPQGELREATVAAAGFTVHPGDWVFELGIDSVMTAYWENWAQSDTYAVRTFWRPKA